MKKISQISRRAFPDDDEKIELNFQVTNEVIPRFLDIRDHIYPIVKHSLWLKRAKEALQQTDSKSTLIVKNISGTNIGIVYAVIVEQSSVTRYISTTELNAWQISEKEMLQYAKENIIKRIGELERTQPLFTETQTGIYYSDRLRELTSSLLAVPDVFNMIPFKTNTVVVVCPSPNLILVSHCHDPKGMCLIGELGMRQQQREYGGPKPLRPYRIAKSSVNAYEASLVRNEATVPINEEQLRNCRKTVFKKSRKNSINNIPSPY